MTTAKHQSDLAKYFGYRQTSEAFGISTRPLQEMQRNGEFVPQASCQGVTGGPARHRLEDVVAWNEVGHIWQSSITCVETEVELRDVAWFILRGA